ncbi:extracellular solute-binding protein [Patescibacteria group bacterium]|nr:extracellular solute-binding protein [Patescibacteria group bacterium]
MTDQKPPAQPNKPVAPQSTAPQPSAPAQAPIPPTTKPAGAPPLPKPNFSVTTPTTPGAPKPPASVTPPTQGKPSAPQPVQQPKLGAQPTGQRPAAPTAKPVSSPSSTPVAPVKTGMPPKPVSAPPGKLPVPPAAPAKPTGSPPPTQTNRPPMTPPKPPGVGALPPLQPGQAPRPVGSPPPVDGRPPTSSIQQAARPTTLPTAKTLPPAKAVSPVGGAVLPKPPSVDPKNQPPAQVPPAPKAAEFKKSPLRFLPLLLGILVVLGVVGFILSRFLGGRSTPGANTPNTGNQIPNRPETVITYWGLWEPTPVLEETLADFEEQNPGIRVNYQQQTYQDYRERLQTAIAGGRGPDVFRYHASWVPMMRAELSPMPASVYTPAEFQSIFFPIASQQLQLNGNYVGVPLMYEGLALVYNREVLQTANAEPPKTWAELGDLASRLTIRNGNQIQRAGLAIGNTANVDNFSDILGLLMLQNGANPQDPTSVQAEEAIRFYTDFYTDRKVWDASLPNSTIAFARGDVAMILVPSWRIHEIMAQNPNLSIGVAPVPQLGGSKVSWASYWAEGVSAQSPNKDEAWLLLKYLSSPDALQKLYSDASKERNFGEIYPRVDMANMLADSPYVAAYLADAPYAQDWYMNSMTHDNGLNDQIIKYYQDAINAVVLGRANSLQEALPVVAQGLLQVLRQYNLTR